MSLVYLDGELRREAKEIFSFTRCQTAGAREVRGVLASLLDATCTTSMNYYVIFISVCRNK